jgi:glycosyltransferase involved in cell wall biosynthesis
MMRIGLYHGYELTGSGSNEYVRYLARSLVSAGQEVHVVCREEKSETIDFVTHAYAWNMDGSVATLFEHPDKTPACYVHQLPHGDVRPVFLTDKQRAGNIKSFITMTDEELQAYHVYNERLLTNILSTHKLDVFHANHVVYQPIAALNACKQTGTPLIVYPHGSSIEYTVRPDKRFYDLALKGILGADGLIIGNREVRDRLLALYPEHRDAILAKTRIVGVGVDTSLFKPVERSQRAASIQQLTASGGGGGKTPELTQELHNRLENADIQATRDYWNAYNHSLPDADLNAHLQRIPWNQHILLFVGALTAGKGIQSLLTALPRVLTEHPDTHLVIVGAGAYREVLEALVYAISSGNKDLLLELCAKGLDLDRSDLTGPWQDVQTYLDDPSNLQFILEHGKSLAQHVHCLGRLDHSRLCYLFPCVDLAIFPSVVPEAYPLVVMESLSNGVFCAVSYFSGFRDSVDDLRPILGARLNDLMKIPVDKETRVAKIVSNLNTLIGDAEVLAIHSKLRQIALDNYDWNLRAQEMVEAYQAFLDGTPVA